MPKNILLLSERDFLTLPIIRSLGRNEYRIFVMGPQTSSVRFSRFCEKYFGYRNWIDNGRTEYINSISRTHGLDAIIPLDLESTVWIADHRTQLNAPSLLVSDASTLRRLHDKWEFTKVLDELTLPYPKTVLVSDREALVPGIMPYPFMMKPLNLEAGQGIVKIENDADLSAYQKTRAGRESYPILVQQYIDGWDVGMSILAVDGKIIAWTSQKRDENGLLELLMDERVRSIGERIVVREKYSGFMHIDLHMDKNTRDIFVLECNPRAWGSINASMLSWADFLDYAVRSTLGLPMSTPKHIQESYLPFHKSFPILLRSPGAFRNLSSITKNDLASVAMDPIPYLLLALVECAKKSIRLMRKYI